MARDTGTLEVEASKKARSKAAGAREDEMPRDEAVSVESLALATGSSFGEGMKAAREALGLSLDDVADVTKVRRHYLNAIETMQLDQLPSRPFAEGYVRAYARVLGIDEARAVARFRQDLPKPDEDLPEPIGVPDEKDPRIAVIVTTAALVLAAIVIWNVAKRAMADREERPAAAIAAAPVTTPTSQGPVQLGDALPPPVEATLPAPYVTPGLEDVDPRAPREEDLADAQPELSRPFQPHGTIYGAAPEQSVVTLQAIRTVLVVIKGPGDRIVFAQPLSPGEAYRVPQASGLIIDVAAPKSIEVFVAGMSKGTLKEPLTPASTLAASAPRPAARPAAPTASTPAPKPTTPPAVASPTAPKATVPAGAAPPAAKAIAPAAAPPPAPKAAPPTAAAPPLAAPAEPSETPAP